MYPAAQHHTPLAGNPECIIALAETDSREIIVNVRVFLLRAIAS